MRSKPVFLPYLNSLTERKTTFVQITPDDGFLICQKRPSNIEVYNDCDGRMLEVFAVMRADPYAFHYLTEHPSLVRAYRPLLSVVQRYMLARKHPLPLSEGYVPKAMSCQKDLAMFLNEFAPEPVAEFMLRWSFVQLEDTTFNNMIRAYDTKQTFFFAWLHKLAWGAEEIMEKFCSVEGWFVVAHNLAWSSPTKAWQLARLKEPDWCQEGWVLFHNIPQRWY